MIRGSDDAVCEILAMAIRKIVSDRGGVRFTTDMDKAAIIILCSALAKNTDDVDVINMLILLSSVVGATSDCLIPTQGSSMELLNQLGN